jgi:hypothetical protein
MPFSLLDSRFANELEIPNNRHPILSAHVAGADSCLIAAIGV